MRTFYNRLCILLLLIFAFLGSNEKKPENKPATPILEKYSEKITVSFGSAKEEKGKEPVKTKGQLISKCPFSVNQQIFLRISALAYKKQSNQTNKGTLYTKWMILF